jgi:nucleotide-binding universal stress UspA family protein
MFKRILVPTDGSDLTAMAVDTAIALAKALGGQIVTLAVKEPFPYGAISEMQPIPPQAYFDAQDRMTASRVQQVQQACAAAGVVCEVHTVDAEQPWQAIIDLAKSSACDLVVMASHGRRGLSALLLGSETQKVLTHSAVPVLVVR